MVIIMEHERGKRERNGWKMADEAPWQPCSVLFGFSGSGMKEKEEEEELGLGVMCMRCVEIKWEHEKAGWGSRGGNLGWVEERRKETKKKRRPDPALIKKRKKKNRRGEKGLGCVCGPSPEEGKEKEKGRRKREGIESKGKQTGQFCAQFWASMLGQFSFIFFLFFLSYTPPSDPTLTLIWETLFTFFKLFPIPTI